MRSSSAVPSSGGETLAFGAAPRRRDLRPVWLLASAAVLSLSTLVAVLQPPRPDPYAERTNLEWFLAPLEANPEQRLPAVAGEIEALWSSPDGERVWAVGEDGLALRSLDGGESWTRIGLGGAAAAVEEQPLAGEAEVEAAESWWRWDLPGGSAEALEDPQSKGSEPPPIDPKQQPPGPQENPDQGLILPPLNFKEQLPLPEDDASGEQRALDPEYLEGANPEVQRIEPPAPTVPRRSTGVAATAPPEAVTAPAPDAAQPFATWTSQVAFVPLGESRVATLKSVHFLDNGQDGWIGTENGDLLRTIDGGEIWEVRSSSDPAVRLVDLYFSNQARGCAALIGPDGSRVSATTTNGGSDWVVGLLDPECSARLQSTSTAVRDRAETAVGLPAAWFEPRLVYPFSTQGTWAAGRGGALAVSQGAGGPWRLTTRSARLGHQALFFLDEYRGFAGGLDGPLGYLAATTDGGHTWNPLRIDLTGAIVDLGFAPGSDGENAFGWAISESGELIVTTDQWQSWEHRTTRGDGVSPLVDADFSDRLNGVARDGAQAIWTTADGGTTWEPHASRSIQIAGLQAGGGGTSGAVISSVPVVSDDGLLAVQDRESLAQWNVPPFVGRLQKRGNLLWIGGADGLTRASLAAIGDKPAFEPLGDGSPVSAFFFLDETHGWRAEPGGGLLSTVDGGRTWSDLTKHSIYPAPWYWLALLLGVVLLVPAVAPPPAARIERSIAEMAVSDQPIGPDDPDPLGFDKVARGLSRFLRNTATRPPLTIAILGEWGTGKSSLMNLVKADLARYGFRPVWFNAWHHQKEEQLLAAMLENIRRQAVPSWLRPEGWIFRGRLLGERLRRWFLPALLMVLLFGVATGWVASSDDGMAGLRAAVELLNPLVWTDWLTTYVAGTGSGTEPQKPQLGWLVSAAGVGYMLFRGLRAFGIKPAQLAAGLSEHARVRDIEAQTGFRYRFSREFADVTRALSPRTLTVMIDDLDRCRPENVLEVLEAVNFLVSSGECFVLLGIDRQRVERCVGYGFREVAEEILDAETAADPAAADPAAGDGGAEAPAAPVPAIDATEAGRRRRAAFARQYLEKLINIEVPVPRVNAETGLGLIHPPSLPPQPRGRWHRAGAWSRRLAASWWLLPMMLVPALAFGFGIGARQGEQPVPDRPAAVAIEESAPPESAPDVPVPTAVEERVPAEPIAARLAGFAPGEPASRPHLFLWGLASLLVVGVGIWLLTTLPEVEVRDSPEFLAALRRCYPLLHGEAATPRSVKRFLNRVRFYAMGQRPSVPPRSRLSAALRWLPRWWPGQATGEAEPAAAAPPSSSSGAIPEEVLVALTAVQHTHPEWLEEDAFWRLPQRYLHQAPPQPGVFAIGSWDRYRDPFRHLSSGVETR